MNKFLIQYKALKKNDVVGKFKKEMDDICWEKMSISINYGTRSKIHDKPFTRMFFRVGCWLADINHYRRYK